MASLPLRQPLCPFWVGGFATSGSPDCAFSVFDIQFFKSATSVSLFVDYTISQSRRKDVMLVTE
jgi:hypothetical protein